ncbi:acetoacetyl-CoA synthetase [Trichonephila clavata]|uniref:Acetoacetyl-CoA synthetase n=1 Tax=Trichonephila clavata TaxID=2740835 RepID=A0A8X6H0Y2_TRICU|nr:acetoacetyl-CoA synthetase [Trichonephila clavata]
MSNRKEAVFAMLAVTSIGAIWEGPQPYLGAQRSNNMISDAPTLEKIIIVPTKEETLTKDLSHIPDSCFLGSFLESGKMQNGEIPDIVFEQLPFDHPVSVAFTSGTTGMPKGAVHSAGSLLGLLMHFTLHSNLKSGDVLHNIFPLNINLETSSQLYFYYFINLMI